MATRKTTTKTETITAVEKTIESIKERKKYALDDVILCRSVCYGELLYPAKKSGILYRFGGYGDTTEIEFQDLQILRSTKSQYIYAPLFLIEDEELLEQWPDVKQVNDKIAQIDGEKIFELPTQHFRKALSELPVGYRTTIRNMANAKIMDGTLDSLVKIKIIDEILGTDLKLLIE